MNKQSQKVLVTGVTGLVGARLLPRLIDAGFECAALVRGGRELPAGATPIAGDVLDPATLADAVKNVSAVIHLAAVFRTADMDLIWKVNLEGTRNLVDALKIHAPNARLILASTSNVYSHNSPHPGREEDAVAPEHPYPASKAAAEDLLRKSGLKWSVLRFPFVYGDGDGHLEDLPKHVVAAKFHPAMRISTIHHRDIFTAMQMALAGTMDQRIVNISDEAPTTIYELLKVQGQAMDSSAQPLQNPWHLHVDGSLARSLGFQAIVRTVHQAVAEGIL